MEKTAMFKFLFLLCLTFVIISAIYFLTTTILIPLTGSQPSSAAGLSKEYVDLLPAGYTIPDTLPANIHDPLLLTGWVYLYNQQKPLQTWNGQPLSGRMLAQYALDQQVIIEWNTINDCSGGSCSERPHAEDIGNLHPILIRTGLQEQGRAKINELAGTLAHEIFHHMLPFGNVPDTLFEEFWGYSTGAQISGSYWMDSAEYNTQNGACLRLWFQDKKLDYYNGLKTYPQVVSAAADESSLTCTIIHKMPGEVDGFPSGK